MSAKHPENFYRSNLWGQCMRMIADLHIHSKYSRATSKSLDLANLEKYALLKGVNLLGTGDFTHPKWQAEIKANLSDDGTGLFRSKSGFPFVLQSEVSLIYSQGGRGRRVHVVLLAPDIGAVDQITHSLLKHGRVDYDGRPIFKIPCPEFVENMMAISPDIEVIPAHIWTPWFSLFGSMSGFDRIEDCFEDQLKNIHALETGLSSDPPMNWRLKSLDRFLLVSNSDLHSFWPWRLGREANVMDIEPSYKGLLQALRQRRGFMETIEVDPNLGKYHLTGHRKCNVCVPPAKSIEMKNICPACRRPLTVGVLQRVEELADRPEGHRPEEAAGFRSLLALSDMISGVMGKAISSKGVWAQYNSLVADGRSEYDVLLDMPEDELRTLTTPDIADCIVKNRLGQITILGGYDGVYGVPMLGDRCLTVADDERCVAEDNVSEPEGSRQTGLLDF